MVNRRRELFNFIKNKLRGYALVTSIILLALICLVVIWQYHYYATQWQLEDQLARDFLKTASNNLIMKK
jgi:hypothetical protein